MKELLGTTKDGQEIYSYTIKNKNGMEAVVMNYGANLLALRIPTANGPVDVETGLEHITDYFNNSCYHGCIVARHANRIGGAAFDLNGKHYELEKNDGNNNLHSGFNPLCDRIYNVDEATDDSVYFTIDSPDMDMGFPGNMHFGVRYRVSDNNSLLIYYDATSDQDTIFNPTSHAYFNLLGHDHNDILTHELFINADKFTYADSESIPDGTIRDVEGTPMDFRTPKAIGRDIEMDYDMLKFGLGYDHNYVLKKDAASMASAEDSYDYPLSLAATLSEPTTGRKMDVFTDLPGIQLYTTNFFDGTDEGKGGVKYAKRGAVALETQYFPNAINVPSFEQPVIKAGEHRSTLTVYKFSGF